LALSLDVSYSGVDANNTNNEQYTSLSPHSAPVFYTATLYAARVYSARALSEKKVFLQKKK
jgi:hypothetical protein